MSLTIMYDKVFLVLMMVDVSCQLDRVFRITWICSAAPTRA